MSVSVSPDAPASRAWLRGAWGLLAAGVSLVALSSCGTATSLLLVVDSNYRAPDEVNAVRVTVLNADGTPQGGSAEVALSATTDLNLNTHALPFSLGLVPGPAGPDQPVHVRVEAIGPGGVVRVQRDVEALYQSGRALLLPVFLARECEGYRCGPGLTCTETGCSAPNAVRVTPVQPGEELATYADARPTVTFDATPEVGPDAPLDMSVPDVVDVATDVPVDMPPPDVGCTYGAHWPAPDPDAVDPTGSVPQVYVMRRLRFGLNPETGARVGWDLDGVNTLSTELTEGCNRRSCDPLAMTFGTLSVADPSDGRDNTVRSFLDVAQLLITRNPDRGLEDILGDQLELGEASVGLRVKDWSGDDNDPAVIVEWLPVINGRGPSTGMSLGDAGRARLTWTEEDTWDINSTVAYSPPGSTNVAVVSNGAYVRNGMMVIPLPSRLPFILSLTGFQLPLTLSYAVLAGPVSEGQIRGLTLGAIWSLSDARTDLRNGGVCQGMDVIDGFMQAAADIRVDLSNTGRRPCDAISIGAELDVARTRLGANVRGPGPATGFCDHDVQPRDASEAGRDDAGDVVDAATTDIVYDADHDAEAGNADHDAEAGDADATAPFDAPG